MPTLSELCADPAFTADAFRLKVRESAAKHGVSMSCVFRARARLRSVPVPKRGMPVEYEDEWTIPTVPTSSTRIAEVVETKRAPSQGGKWERFVAFSDSHGKHYHHATIEMLLRFTDDWAPHHLLGLGDFWDFGAMRDGATIEEKSENMRPDWEKGCDILHRFYSGRNAKKYAVLGNHCHRPFKWLDKGDGVYREFAAHKVAMITEMFKQMKVEWHPYHKRSFIQVGKLIGVHGFGGGGVNAAKSHAQWYATAPGSVVLFGHTHRVALHSESNIAAPQCYNIGCCCELDLGYNDLQPGTLAQRHGFAYGAAHAQTGAAVVWQAQEVEGDWILPSDVMG